MHYIDNGRKAKRLAERKGGIRMRLVRWRPKRTETMLPFTFPRVGTLFEDMDKFFEEWPVVSYGERMLWHPTLDIFEEKEELVVKVELPGIKPEEVDITVEDGYLTISGEKKVEKEVKEEDFIRHERSYGLFKRSISLPTLVEAEKIKALYKDGILEVRLPKKEEFKPKKVKVEVK